MNLDVYPRVLNFQLLENEEEQELVIYQEVLTDVGGVVWDSALMASYYFLKNRKNWEGKKVLELGSGTGVCGIALATIGADVIVSDLEERMELLNKNIAENLKHFPTAHIKSQVLDWTKDVSPPNLDLLLAVDCIYYNSSILPLLNFLKNSDAREILIVSEKRDIGEASAAQSLFFEKVSEFFHVIPVAKCDFDDDYYADDIIFVNLVKK